MGDIIIEDQKYSFKDIQSGNWPEQKSYFEASLLFCREWLNGKDTFELKTSGSTGIPKAIQVRRAQMVSSAKATGDFFEVQPHQHLLCCLNTAMIAGKMMLVRAMEWNSILHLVDPTSHPLMGFPSNQTFDFAAMVPLQLEACLESEKTKKLLNQIKNLIIGGAPVSPPLRKKASLLTMDLFQTYGMTETVSHIALANLKDSGQLTYQTLPGVRIRQTSDQRLQINTAMANEAWILTNDIVEIKSETSFIWKGRADFTINSGGLKIQPEEVEARIVETVHQFFPSLRFFVGSRPDAKLGQKLILILEGKEETQYKAENLLSILKDMLPKYQKPKEIHFMAPFVETASGKVNRLETVKKLLGE
ncbi:MAG: AMP-binding protein [Anditalea sp.]